MDGIVRHNDNRFPALHGETVTEAHAKTCQEQGHATHTVDGVPSAICPRCGDHRTPNRDDIGRVFVHGTTVRGVLLAINPADNCEYDVLFHTLDKPIARVWVDFRNLAATDERSDVRLATHWEVGE